jgi:purine nucleosidase
VVASRVRDFRLAGLSTVFGNASVDIATRNACLFRRLLAHPQEVPIFRGAQRAADGFISDAIHVFGDDGLGGVVQTIDKDLLQAAIRDCPVTPIPEHHKITSEAERITIIGIGPATNVPKLVSYYGKRNVERIVLMSGAFFDVGNITDAAEFNAYCDPLALRETLAFGLPTTLVPLDLCRKILLSRSTIESYRDLSGSVLMKIIVEAHSRYMDYCLKWAGTDGCFPHDAITVLVASRREAFYRIRGRVHVDVGSDLRGRTRITLDDTSEIELVMGGDLKWVREGLARLHF